MACIAQGNEQTAPRSGCTVTAAALCLTSAKRSQVIVALANRQEALDYGWWEAIVISRDMFTLRFRDYPKLPKFVRHRNAIALMSPPAETSKP